MEGVCGRACVAEGKACVCGAVSQRERQCGCCCCRAAARAAPAIAAALTVSHGRLMPLPIVPPSMAPPFFPPPVHAFQKRARRQFRPSAAATFLYHIRGGRHVREGGGRLPYPVVSSATSTAVLLCCCAAVLLCCGTAVLRCCGAAVAGTPVCGRMGCCPWWGSIFPCPTIARPNCVGGVHSWCCSLGLQDGALLCGGGGGAAARWRWG